MSKFRIKDEQNQWHTLVTEESANLEGFIRDPEEKVDGSLLHYDEAADQWDTINSTTATSIPLTTEITEDSTDSEIPTAAAVVSAIKAIESPAEIHIGPFEPVDKEKVWIAPVPKFQVIDDDLCALGFGSNQFSINENQDLIIDSEFEDLENNLYLLPNQDLYFCEYPDLVDTTIAQDGKLYIAGNQKDNFTINEDGNLVIDADNANQYSINNNGHLIYTTVD